MNIFDKDKIAQLAASGKSQNEIAEITGYTQPTISKVSKEYSDKINEYAEEYLKALPSIVDQDINEFKAAKDLSGSLIKLLKTPATELNKDDLMGILDEKKMGYLDKFLNRVDKKAEQLKRAIQLLPAKDQAIAFNQFNLTQNTQVISPQVLNLLSGKISEITAST